LQGKVPYDFMNRIVHYCLYSWAYSVHVCLQKMFTSGLVLIFMQMKFSDGQSEFSRVFNFTILGYSRNMRKLGARKKLAFSVLFVCLWLGLFLWHFIVC